MPPLFEAPSACLTSYREDPKLTLWGGRGVIAGSLRGEMAGKIVELRAALLVQGAVRLVHAVTERKAHIRAMPPSKRGFR